VTPNVPEGVPIADKIGPDDRRPEAGGQPSIAPGLPQRQRPLRVAYVGPTPQPGGRGPEGCAWLILGELARSGVQLDCYLASSAAEHVKVIDGLPSVRIISAVSAWQWDRWYSRSHLMAMVTGLGTRAFGRRRLANLLVKRHELVRYDAVYQFSTIEIFGRLRDRRRLPPLVLHPSVHAAGELRWMRQERDLSKRCEGWIRPLVVMFWFLFRSLRQRRDIRRAAVVLALSEAFGRHLVEDYGVEPTRVLIAPNPIDLEGFRPPRSGLPTPRRLTIAVVGRLSVRKGLEVIVQLSHRLRDLSGTVHVEIVGGPSQWSNYDSLLDDVDPTIASSRGSLSHHELAHWLPTCDMLVHPAKYEPFGLTVGEALACGLPVVVTTAVGAGEAVSEACCTRVPPGDLDALEGAVRGMVARLRSPTGMEMHTAARSEAERLWSAASVTPPVMAALLQAAGFETGHSASSQAGRVDLQHRMK
jgi:glycosyltransferase involved in cell wall biosynthesis